MRRCCCSCIRPTSFPLLVVSFRNVSGAHQVLVNRPPERMSENTYNS